MTRQRGNIFFDLFVEQIRTQSGHHGVGVGDRGGGPPTPAPMVRLGVGADPHGKLGPPSVPPGVSLEVGLSPPRGGQVEAKKGSFSGYS